VAVAWRHAEAVLFDEYDDGDDGRAPICPTCGVTALPADARGATRFVCENPDCESFGEAV
jgi:hypothetical protein